MLAARAEADILLTDCMRQKGDFAVKRKSLLEIRSRGEKIGAGDRFLHCFNIDCAISAVDVKASLRKRKLAY